MDPKALSVLADALRDALPEEDAADALKWAQNPEAVRELLKHTPLTDGGDEPVACPACGTLQRVFQGSHKETCRVFLAWAALDDPRAAEAIGAAFDRARPVTQPFNHGGGDWAWRAATAPPTEHELALFPERYGRPLGERAEVRQCPERDGGRLALGTAP